MRIAYLTCVYPPYPGGIGIVAQGLAQEMARRGHDAHIYTSRSRVTVSPPVSSKSVGDETVKPNPYEQRNRQRNPVTVHHLRPWLRFGNAAFLPQLLWRLRGFDVVHVLYPFFGAAEFVPLFRVFSRAKIVVHHTMDALDSGWRGKVFKLHSKYIMPRIFRAADFVIVLSEDYYKNSELTRLSFPKEKFGVVPNGVDVDLFQPRQTVSVSPPVSSGGVGDETVKPHRYEQQNHQRNPIILFIGGLDRAHYFKGVPVLLEACRILKDRGVKFCCQIVGEGEMRAEYERQAKDSPSAEGLSLADFVGLVLHGKLPAYYQQATVAVVPSTERVECFSIVAAEAQACGIPAIVTDFPGVRVTVEDKVTGYVVAPSDARTLARRIQELIKDPVHARVMGAAGRQRAVELYSWKKIGEKLEKIYHYM